MIFFLILFYSCKTKPSLEDIQNYSLEIEADSLESCSQKIHDFNKQSFLYCLKNFGTSEELLFFYFLDNSESFFKKNLSGLSYEVFKKKIYYYANTFLAYSTEQEEFLKTLHFFQKIDIKEYLKEKYWSIVSTYKILSLEEILHEIHFFSLALKLKKKLTPSILIDLLKTYSISLEKNDYFDDFLITLHESYKNFNNLSILEKKFSLKYTEIREYLNAINLLDPELKKMFYPPDFSTIFCQKMFSLFYRAIHSEKSEHIESLQLYLFEITHKKFFFHEFLSLSMQEKCLYFSSFFIPLHEFSDGIQDYYNEFYKESKSFLKEVFSK